MGGGAYLLTQLGNRSTFKDIDVLLEDIPDPSGSPLYLPFQQAMRAVAARHDLAANWINDVIGDALRTYGPTPTRTPWRVYGPLEVLVPERAYILILALKLLAHRTQDEADIHTLCQELWIGTRAPSQSGRCTWFSAAARRACPFSASRAARISSLSCISNEKYSISGPASKTRTGV